MKIYIASIITAISIAATPALAWGDLAHEVVGLIAYRHLTPAVKTKIDLLLASDADTLTAPDIGSRATWADKYRSSHRQTAAWHFVDIEINNPDLSGACSGFPPTAPGLAASQGPAQDCVVDKIAEFAAELRDPATTLAERGLALKFLLHLVGDLHQPLHASDDSDRGGNCIGLSPPPDGEAKNLHAFWDTTVVKAIGVTPRGIAAKLNARISAKNVRAWSTGDPKAWAMESFAGVAHDAYNLPSKPTCATPGPVTLSPTYLATAGSDAAHQLEVAGVRLAFVLLTFPP